MSCCNTQSCDSVDRKRFLFLSVKLSGAILSGLLLSSAFPPAESSECAWLALVPLIVIARYTRPLRAFLFGLLSGLTFWLWSLSWLLAMMNCGCGFPMVALAWISLSVYCSLYTGAFALVVSRIFISGESISYAKVPNEDKYAGYSMMMTSIGRFINVLYVFAIPALWVGFEYLRSTLFGGFPWNAVGISQYRNIAIIQMAEWGGVYAVSAVVVMMNAVMAVLISRFIDVYARGIRTGRLHFELIMGLAIGLFCLTNGVKIVRRVERTDSSGLSARIAMVQPNIRQALKWDESQVMEVYRRLMEHTEIAVAGAPDIVVWPETAVLNPVEGDENTVYCASNQAEEFGVHVLTGVIEREGVYDEDELFLPTRVFNGSFLVGPDGRIMDRYRKRHLVPFGEHVPFDKTLTFLQRFVPIGETLYSGESGTIFSVPISKNGVGRSIRFSVLICFEDIMAGLARDDVKEGARLLVNQTNDGWFDGSSEHVQHMSHCVFRCVENRVPAVRSANTGVTCFIDRTGRVGGKSYAKSSSLPVGSEGVVITPVLVPDEDMALTFYTKYGDIPFALPCGTVSAVLLAAVFVEAARARKRRKGSK